MCEAGQVGFLKTEGQLVLFCNECDATWLSPFDVGVKPHILQQTDEAAAWATLREIEANGWRDLIAGEYND